MGPAQGMIYFVNLTTLEKVEAQYIPDKLSQQRASDPQEVKIIGRNTPRYQTIGGAKTMQIILDFHAEEASMEDVVRNVRMLESFASADGDNRKQPSIKVVWGRFFKNERWLLKQVNPEYKLFNREQGMLPRQCIVTLTFTLDESKNQTWEDIRWQ